MAGQNIDVTGYQNWETIIAPTGQVYYKVPGSGLVYDPFLSRSKGRNVFFQNPQPGVDAQHKAEKAAKKAASPLGQITPVVGSTAGIVGAKYIIDALGPTTVADKALEADAALKAAQTQILQQEAARQAAANATAQQALGEIPSYGGFAGPDVASAQTAQQAFTDAAVPTPPPGFAGGPSADVGATTDATGTGAGLLAQAPGTESVLGVPAGVLPALGVAAGAYTGMQQLGGLQNAIKGKEMSTMQKGALALPTFGLSLFADKIPGFTHKSTKEYEAERWGDLAKNGVVGAAEQYQRLNSLGDMSGKMITDTGEVKKWNFEDALNQVKKDPTQFREVYGNFKTFGNDWHTYTDDQKNAIVSGLANAGLYYSSKGDVLVKDEEEARKIKDQVLAGGSTGTVAPVQAPAPVPAAKPQVMQTLPPAKIGEQLAQRMNNWGRR